MSSSVFAINNKISPGAGSIQVDDSSNSWLAGMLVAGYDPLGDAFMNENSADTRRASGSTYTPQPIVDAMVKTAAEIIEPAAVVDCGCGSGRYALACSKAFPSARIFAIDNSDVACNMCRANVAASGLASTIEVIRADFTTFDVERPDGPVLWIGNPPYVRHHGIDKNAKEMFKATAASLGLKASGLAGLHAHFLASIARQWRESDLGVLVMSAEWLDVNYGEFMRRVLAERLGLISVQLFDKTTRVFETADTTAVIVVFGNHVDEVEAIRPGGSSKMIPATALCGSSRWSQLIMGNEPTKVTDEGLVPLGSLARVHRGVVTGDNKFWVRRADELGDIPDELTVPVVAHAREITGDCIAQKSPSALARLIVLPEEPDKLTGNAYGAAQRVIAQGKARGVDTGYVASRRRRWWSVRPPAPPAVLMTYMGRKRPTFVVNEQKLPMLNVVHGLYPRAPMSKKAISNLVSYLNESVDINSGRIYCGGLVKFEPKEAEAIMVPALEALEA